MKSAKTSSQQPQQNTPCADRENHGRRNGGAGGAPIDGYPPDSWTCCKCWTDYQGVYTNQCTNCGHIICSTCPQI
ncbi:hypothetical protein GTA08_BOTSDO01667 [Botryosphaeria dothidea]|uniref:Uncharacterized protein n=1 Tax=Botryosphaeria dothidea TaxID=55169 RepID=A0A8H4NB75_9PEZI|nr:hypothetical protein GTA08_BOTSDO01667 [Botryosphaeria dothidea]